MKLKELQSLMQDIAPFDQPKFQLEQYTTGVELAARMLYTIDAVHDDFEGKTVIDMGCGTGRLAIGAALLGSPHVLGLDVDAAALDACARNLEQFEDLPVDLVQCDVGSLEGQARLAADTVLMNPPFGTRCKGADLQFLRAGLKVARGAVYSLHKSSTRAHIQKLADAAVGLGRGAVLAQLRYDLPATYAFHKQKSKDIEVDLWRFDTSGSSA